MEMLKFRNENVEENDSIEIQNALLMVIFLYSKVEFPMAHLLMIEDFISFHKEYDKEKNIILKFKVKKNKIFFILISFNIRLHYNILMKS